MLKLKSLDRKDSRWRIYDTKKAQRRALRGYLKRGYRYFVLWKDVNGFGLEAARRAQWQPAGECPAYIDW